MTFYHIFIGIYCFLAAFVIGYSIFKKRKFDILVIYVFSSIVYFFPAFIGEFQSFVFLEKGYTYKPQEIYYKSYLVLIINLMVCLVWMFMSDCRRHKNTYKKTMDLYLNDYESIIVVISEIVILCLNFILCYRLRNYIFVEKFDKTKLMEHMTLFDTLALNMTYYFFIISFSCKMRWKKVSMVIALLCISYSLALAKRSELVLGIIAVAYVWVTRNSESSLWELLWKRKYLLLTGLVFFCAVFLSKPVLNAAVQGDWKQIFMYFKRDGKLIESFIYSESNVITSNLNEILRLNVTADGDTYRFASLGFIPFIGTLSDSVLVPSDFYELYQPIVYPKISGWGAANCFLAEAVSNGGILTLICMVHLLCCTFVIMEKILYKNMNVFIKTGILAAMPHLAFYIHRNTLFYIIRTVRIFAYISFFLIVIHILLTHKHPDRRNLKKIFLQENM
ncbi:MAG: hypothetical protein HFG46_12935 [Clostridium sp.]|nr:hypothetical protein [Clostridium sp.]